MVAFAQPERLILYQPRSKKSRSTGEVHHDSEKKRHSRGHTLVVAEQSTELLMTNDLLVFSEWIIQLRPLSSERLVVQRLMRPQLVVIVQIRSNQIVEMLLAKDRKEIQTFDACGFYPSLNESILLYRQLHPIATMGVEVFG